MKKNKKSHIRHGVYFQSYENRQVFKRIISIYKPIFFRWLKDKGYYDFYHECYYDIHGNTCNFERLLLSNMSKCDRDVIHNDLIRDFVLSTLGCYYGHSLFNNDSMYDRLYCMGEDWVDYADELLSKSELDLRSRVKSGSYTLKDKLTSCYHKK